MSLVTSDKSDELVGWMKVNTCTKSTRNNWKRWFWLIGDNQAACQFQTMQTIMRNLWSQAKEDALMYGRRV